VSGRGARVLLGLALACLAAFQQFKLPVALPALLAAYGYERTLAGGFMSVYAVAGLALSVPVGRALERGAAGRVVAAALAAIGAGIAVVLAYPASGWVVLGGRALEGAGFAALAVTGSVLATTQAAPRLRARVTGVLAAWIPIGQLAAAALAPALLALGGWRALWLAALALTAAAALWARAIAADGPLLAAARPRPAAGPAARLEGTARRSLWLASAVFMLWVAQYFAFMTWLPQYLVESYGLGAAGASLGYALPVALLLAMCLATGWAIDAGARVGRLMVAGLVVQVLAWWLAALAAGPVGGLAVLALYGLSAGVVPTCLFATPALLTGAGAGTARAFGVMMTGRNLGVLIGPVAAALLFELAGGWEPAAPALGTVTLAALALAVPLASRLR